MTNLRLLIAADGVPSYNNAMRVTPFRVISLVLIFSVASAAVALAQEGALGIGLSSLPTELDPATAVDGPVTLIARQVFDTLVQSADGSSDVEPALAERWTVSRDGLLWTFRLRAGVMFHDGSPLTAQHVVDSLVREIRPGHPFASGGRSVVPRLLRGAPGVVKEIRAKDPRTVEISLVQPYAPLLTVLAQPAFAVVLPAPPGAPNGMRWQGTGPFSVAEIAAGRVVLSGRARHWRGGPRLGRIVLSEVADEAQARTALDAQQLQLFFPSGAPARLDGAMSIPSWRVGYLALRTEKDPFKRVKARRAVAAALDPGLIGAALGQGASLLQTFLPSGVWSRRDGPPLMGGDAARARRLLGEAGLPPGAAAALAIVEGDKGVDQRRVAEAIRASLAAAALTVTIATETAEAALSLAQSGEGEMVLAEARVEAGDPHFLLYPLSTSEGAAKGPAAVNFSFYRDARLDDLLVRASQLFFRPERQRLYIRAQTLLAEELPWIPIYVRLHWVVARPEVRGLRLHPSGNPRLDRVWLEAPASAPPPGG
jgi:peptide/nickel transport system substrate-binding protein